MKILYIAPEHDPAGLPARALHEIAHDVALTWADTPASALHWLEQNRDAAAIVVEVQAQSCASFVDQVRGRGLTTPVVVVLASFQGQRSLAALNAGAAGYIVAGPWLQTELPRVVGQAIARERGRRQRQENEQRVQLAMAAARLADVEARHTAAMTREARISSALQERLFELEGALRTADERAAAEAGAFADQVAKRHAEFTASLTQTLQSRDALAGKLGVVSAALDEAHQARRVDAAAASEHLRRREAELGAVLMDAVAARATLERAVAESEDALREFRQRAETDLAAANERQAATEDLLAQEMDRRTNLDRVLAAAQDAQQESDRRHATELARAATRLTDVEARYHAAVEETSAAHAAFERRSAEAAVERQGVDKRHAAELLAAESRLAGNLAQHESAVIEHAAVRAALEAQLADAASREAALTGHLARASDAHAALDRDLAGVRLESASARRRLLYVVSAHRRRAREQQARLEAQLTSQRAEAARERRDRDEEIQEIRLESHSLRHLLGSTKGQLQELHRVLDEERQTHERARLASESDFHRLSAEYGHLRQSFDRLQASFQTLEQIAGDHAAERTRLESVVSARDSELSALAEHHRLADQAAHDAFAGLEDTLRGALAASATDTARHQREIEALRQNLEASRADADTTRVTAARVPDLQAQLDLSQRERRREFERAPSGLCRCTQDGVITEANHSFVAMLGYRRVDELRNMDLATMVSDGAGDVGWLFERARSVRRTEAVETGWKTREGRDLVVRLHALATASGTVEVVVEDITAARSLEARLRQAQRMEAVGRLASEVAVTCDALLGDVTRGVQAWIAASGTDEARRQGERLLTDVSRTAGYLGQLGVYGEQQVRALEPVSVQRVLNDLAPVLRRVVGDQIALVLPKSSGSFDVDVDEERLQRVLVNVAGYARERMPSGGQMRIGLETTALGRRVVSRYPNVRPGNHVLITVTELPKAGQFRRDSDGGASQSEKPGVDLGALVGLIGECGGHLWMEAQPAGNMVVKMYLPRRAADPAEARAAGTRSERGGRLARWFRATPAAGLRA